MFDVARDYAQYSIDTEVVDVDEPVSRSFPRGRVDTADLDVHIQDAYDYWHRLHPTKLITACGKPIHWPGRTRAGLHADGPFAPPEECDCWSKAERAEAQKRADDADFFGKGPRTL